MNKRMPVCLVLSACAAVAQLVISPLASGQEGKGLRVVSDQTVSGFAYPESIAYDPKAKVLYMGQFGPELKPAEKDGKGRISKLSLDGKVLEDRFLPAHGETLHKPKGIWVRGDRLWVTDIDVVWIFDLKSRKGRKLDLPGILRDADQPETVRARRGADPARDPARPHRRAGRSQGRRGAACVRRLQLHDRGDHSGGWGLHRLVTNNEIPPTYSCLPGCR